MRMLKSIVFSVSLLMGVVFGGVVFADVNDFYFKSGAFDYYLSRAENGGSVMKVEEELVAVFPEYDQNHGIERCLPGNYKGVRSLDIESFKVTRNESLEDFTVYENGGQTCFRIGDINEYVHGEQVYKIFYNNLNVIFEPTDSEHQELYWNANGTGWSQKFNEIVVKVHLDDEISEFYVGKPSCYVGEYGVSGENATSRCDISVENDDTVVFNALDLSAGETLTFDLQLQPSTFNVIRTTNNVQNKKEKVDYKKNEKTELSAVDICMIALVIVVVLAFLLVYLYYWIKYRKKFPKVNEVVCPMEYVPPKNLSVAEAEMLNNGFGKVSNSAVVLELVLKHKIELIEEKTVRKKLFTKREDQTIKWKFHIKNLDGLNDYQSAVLIIINNNHMPEVGDVLELTMQESGYSTRKALIKGATESTIDTLKRKGLVKGDVKRKDVPFWLVSCQVIVGLILMYLLFFGVVPVLLIKADSGITNPLFAWMGAFGFMCCLLLPTVFLPAIYNGISDKRNLAKYYTDNGLSAKLHLIGLEKYMKLAESERIKFLQSVDGADVSEKGIVKIYEKLLPYAVIFKMDKTWMEELEKYYEAADLAGPSWAVDGGTIDFVDLGNFSDALSLCVGNSGVGAGDYMSGGDFSGGDGGGFSGGGGGGGGGGGW